jgi:hypothetical protein
MPRVLIRPTMPEDLPHLIAEPLPFRVRCFTAILMTDDATRDDASYNGSENADSPGAVIGIGGVAFPPSGPAWAFVQRSPLAKRYPLSLHRAGLMAMAMIRESGLHEVVATADASDAAALRWLLRLGFIEADHQDIKDKVLFILR